jgi:hypothetical protein
MTQTKTAYTPRKGKRVLTLLREGYGVQRAAEAIGVTRKTIYNWRDAFPEFGDEFDDIQEGITDSIERTVIQKALDGDTVAGIFMLKSRRRPVYGERQAIEHSGAEGKPFTIIIEKPE